MLAIGIWTIAIILLIAHWEKVGSAISGIFGLCVLLAFLAGGAFTVYLAWQHRQQVIPYIGVVIACLMGLFYLALLVLSPIHLYRVIRKIGINLAFKTVFERWIPYFIAGCLIVISLTLFLPPFEKDGVKVALSIWGIAFAILALYSHSRLCGRFNPTCKILPYLFEKKK